MGRAPGECQPGPVLPLPLPLPKACQLPLHLPNDAVGAGLRSRPGDKPRVQLAHVVQQRVTVE